MNDPETWALDEVRRASKLLNIPEPKTVFREHSVALPNSGEVATYPVAYVREETSGGRRSALDPPELRIAPAALTSMSAGALRYRIVRALASRGGSPSRAIVPTLLGIAATSAAAAGILTWLLAPALVSMHVLLVACAAILFFAVIATGLFKTWELASMRRAIRREMRIVELNGDYDAALQVFRDDLTRHKDLFERAKQALYASRLIEPNDEGPSRPMSDLEGLYARFAREVERRRAISRT